MRYSFENYIKAAQEIRNIIGFEPETGIFLGSGLGALTDKFKDKKIINCKNISGFPRRQEAVEGHAGTIVAGILNGKKVIALSGRFHIYEGFSVEESVFPVRVLKLLGVKNLILTNACGGISEKLGPGDLMLIEDHLSFFCPSPLKGPNIEQFGTRFPDMGDAYDKDLLDIAMSCAVNKGIEIKKGVYAYMKGPMYESPAEVIALRALGADAVGMSTVAETITASHCGMRVLGISCIANIAADILGRPITHQEVIDVIGNSTEKIIVLIENVISEL